VTADPEFLTLEEVVEIHRDQLAHWGGSDGIRDRGAIESAIAVPSASFGGEFLHDDLFQMAAAYAFHIAEAQAFLDGNKRTGLNAALMFLLWNQAPHALRNGAFSSTRGDRRARGQWSPGGASSCLSPCARSGRRRQRGKGSGGRRG
jgi:death-on-curing family protein